MSCVSSLEFEDEVGGRPRHAAMAEVTVRAMRRCRGSCLQRTKALYPCGPPDDNLTWLMPYGFISVTCRADYARV